MSYQSMKKNRENLNLHLTKWKKPNWKDYIYDSDYVNPGKSKTEYNKKISDCQGLKWGGMK